jgi:hypothetical protein
MPSKPKLTYHKLIKELRTLQKQLKKHARGATPPAKRAINVHLKRLETYETRVLASCARADESRFLAFGVIFGDGAPRVSVKRRRPRPRGKRQT